MAMSEYVLPSISPLTSCWSSTGRARPLPAGRELALAPHQHHRLAKRVAGAVERGAAGHRRLVVLRPGKAVAHPLAILVEVVGLAAEAALLGAHAHDVERVVHERGRVAGRGGRALLVLGRPLGDRRVGVVGPE